jgi:hypothetical protein
MFEPRRPEVVEVRRGNAGTISVGDEAWCRHGAGLLALLTETPVPGVRTGSGTHPMTGLPIGMAVHAAIVACDGEQTGIGTSRALTATLESPMGPADTVLSHARIEEIGARHVDCACEAYADESPRRLIARVRVTLVRVEDGRAAPLFP